VKRVNRVSRVATRAHVRMYERTFLLSGLAPNTGLFRLTSVVLIPCAIRRHENGGHKQYRRICCSIDGYRWVQMGM
jgi:hypothetical protein